MTSDKRDFPQARRDSGPQFPEREMLRGEVNDPCASVFLPSLIAPQTDAQLLSCALLSPVKRPAPDLQFETAHTSTPQIFRKSPGEILVEYERTALFEVASRGVYGD